MTKPGRVAKRTPLAKEIHRNRAILRQAHWRGRPCRMDHNGPCDPNALYWLESATLEIIRSEFQAYWYSMQEPEPREFRALLASVRAIVAEAEGATP